MTSSADLNDDNCVHACDAICKGGDNKSDGRHITSEAFSAE